MCLEVLCLALVYPLRHWLELRHYGRPSRPADFCSATYLCIFHSPSSFLATSMSWDLSVAQTIAVFELVRYDFSAETSDGSDPDSRTNLRISFHSSSEKNPILGLDTLRAGWGGIHLLSSFLVDWRRSRLSSRSGSPVEAMSAIGPSNKPPINQVIDWCPLEPATIALYAPQTIQNKAIRSPIPLVVLLCNYIIYVDSQICCGSFSANGERVSLCWIAEPVWKA